MGYNVFESSLLESTVISLQLIKINEKKKKTKKKKRQNWNTIFLDILTKFFIKKKKRKKENTNSWEQ